MKDFHEITVSVGQGWGKGMVEVHSEDLFITYSAVNPMGHLLWDSFFKDGSKNHEKLVSLCSQLSDIAVEIDKLCKSKKPKNWYKTIENFSLL
jgi:hypothetical protein